MHLFAEAMMLGIFGFVCFIVGHMFGSGSAYTPQSDEFLDALPLDPRPHGSRYPTFKSEEMFVEPESTVSDFDKMFPIEK